MTQDRFSQQEREQILAAIREAELNTSGEIKVHIEKTCKKDVMDRAAKVFATLGMHKTELRNGVLFYIAFADRKFAILGDGGINAVVPDNFWDGVKERMLSSFQANKYADGLSEGIIMAGEQLKSHFPYEEGDRNELSDDISFGDN
jgi:uncharacterized membrane protein